MRTKNKAPQWRMGALALAALLLTALLAGCGGSASKQDAMAESAAAVSPNNDTTYDTGDYGAEEAPMAAAAAGTEAAPMPETYEGETGTEADTDVGAGDSPALDVPQDDRKVILNAYLEMETLDFSRTSAAINAAISKHGGYVSAADVRSGEVQQQAGNRTANYTIRIPAEKYTLFLSDLEGAGNVVNRNESSEDVTAQYVDTESRIAALRAQEARLLELMETAGSLKDLLTIQEQLTDVQYEIERFTSQKQTYDGLVAYSTVNLYLYEVAKIEDPAPVTYGERIAQAFRETWAGVASFFQEMGVGLVYGLPFLIVLAVAAVIIVPILLRRRKKRREEEAAGHSNAPSIKQGTIKPEEAPGETRDAAPQEQAPDKKD